MDFSPVNCKWSVQDDKKKKKKKKRKNYIKNIIKKYHLIFKKLNVSEQASTHISAD